MNIKFGVFAAALLHVATAELVTAATHQGSNNERNLSTCGYNIEYPVTTETNIFWTGTGSDREWLNKANWQYNYLPGVHKFNRLIMAVNDKATVHCDATYMVANVAFEARSSATLDVSANLNIGDSMVLKTNAIVTQTSSSSVAVGKNLYLDAKYFLSGTSQLSMGLDMHMTSNGEITIMGDGTSITANNETPTNSQIDGHVKYILGPSGTGLFDLQGHLTIGSTTAKIDIDATSYTGGTKSIPLIKYTSVTGSISPANVIITLPAGVTANVVNQSDGIYLNISDGSPTQDFETNSPSPSQIESPAMNPVESTPEPTDSPVDSSVTTIEVGASGFQPITSTGTCPAEDSTSIVIDGTGYTGGPGSIRIYDCAFANANYDLMKFQLKNFGEGLWFELVFNAGSIDLIIKSLTDYSGYWARVKNTFLEDYPEQQSTEHFPTFSWDTVPTWVRFRKNIAINEYTDTELESIATNHHLSWYGLSTPDHVKEVQSRIKGFKADHTTMLYWNAESYWGSAIETFNEAWLTDGLGSGDRALYDYSDPAMRDWWVDHAKLMANHPNISGVFTDNTLSPGEFVC